MTTTNGTSQNVNGATSIETPTADVTPTPRDLTLIGPRAVILLDYLEAEDRKLRKALKRNRAMQEHLAVIVALTR